ncbi:hypothetical protein HCN44_002106 [Aphidius gifuensis]|uniref:Helicase C-terminal domain-containing protein n=1 Tax=Aphidius gifuensis TaxID=684658 RepID=A0A834Y3J8_APHGI|nr:hypothetical protein HCN44_002106 [Aphidius gifuensis]
MDNAKSINCTGKTLAYLLPILERLLYLSSNSPAVTRVLILVPTRKLGTQDYQTAIQVAHCYASCVKIGELHGNLSQPQRMENIKKFKNEEIDVLITTDVAACGSDISVVKTVINFVMPATMQHYIHRVGRTARAGKTGVSVSLADEQERSLVKDIH